MKSSPEKTSVFETSFSPSPPRTKFGADLEDLKNVIKTTGPAMCIDHFDFQRLIERNTHLDSGVVHFSECGNIHKSDFDPTFPNCQAVLFDRCDKNFVYYWLNPSTFPKVKYVVLFCHPCENVVYYRFAAPGDGDGDGDGDNNEHQPLIPTPHPHFFIYDMWDMLDWDEFPDPKRLPPLTFIPHLTCQQIKYEFEARVRLFGNIQYQCQQLIQYVSSFFW